MTANPNSAWGCQAREFIKSIGNRASGDAAAAEQRCGVVEDVCQDAYLPSRTTAPAAVPSPLPQPGLPNQQRRQDGA